MFVTEPKVELGDKVCKVSTRLSGRMTSDSKLTARSLRGQVNLAAGSRVNELIEGDVMATEAPFADKEYLDRYQRAQALMERDGLDALVVSEKNNYWYFSGLISYQLDHIQRPQICILPKSGKPLLLVYGNDKTKAKALPWVGEVRAYTDVPFPEEMIGSCLKEMGLGEVEVRLRARRRSASWFSGQLSHPTD